MILIVTKEVTPVQKMILEGLLLERKLPGRIIDLATGKLESLNLGQASLLIGIGPEVISTVLTLTEGRPMLSVKLIPAPLPQVVGYAYNLDLFLEAKEPRLALLQALDCHCITQPSDVVEMALQLEVKGGRVTSTPAFEELEKLVVDSCRDKGFCFLRLGDLPMVVYEHPLPNLKDIKLEFPLDQFQSFLELCQDPDIKLLSVKDRLGARHRLP